MTAAARVLAQTEETGRDLPVEPWVLGVGSFGLLVVLLLVTMVFGRYR
jgi:hypothetical protein